MVELGKNLTPMKPIKRFHWARGARPLFPQRRQFQNLTKDNYMNKVNQDFPNEAIKALERGSKVEAIKCIRIAYGVGLKEAKEIVEQFIERSPNVKNRMVSANAESAKGGLRWLLLIAAIGVVAYYFFSGSH